MKKTALCAALALVAGCQTENNMPAMRGFIGMPIGRVIISNGQPESRVRIAPDKVAYTLHKSAFWISGSGGHLRSNSLDCRFTFIVRETGGYDPSSVVIGVEDPGPGCR